MIKVSRKYFRNNLVVEQLRVEIPKIAILLLCGTQVVINELENKEK